VALSARAGLGAANKEINPAVMAIEVATRIMFMAALSGKRNIFACSLGPVPGSRTA
jgi:hypothetical protein